MLTLIELVIVGVVLGIALLFTLGVIVFMYTRRKRGSDVMYDAVYGILEGRSRRMRLR